jgi:hypothetical protein
MIIFDLRIYYHEIKESFQIENLRDGKKLINSDSRKEST